MSEHSEDFSLELQNHCRATRSHTAHCDHRVALRGTQRAACVCSGPSAKSKTRLLAVPSIRRQPCDVIKKGRSTKANQPNTLLCTTTIVLLVFALGRSFTTPCANRQI